MKIQSVSKESLSLEISYRDLNRFHCYYFLRHGKKLAIPVSIYLKKEESRSILFSIKGVPENIVCIPEHYLELLIDILTRQPA